MKLAITNHLCGSDITIPVIDDGAPLKQHPFRESERYAPPIPVIDDGAPLKQGGCDSGAIRVAYDPRHR